MHRRDRGRHLLHDEEELSGRGFTLRPGTAADAEELSRTVGEGFAGYRAFAPPGWRPPLQVSDPGPIRERLIDPESWCLVGESGGEVAGHASFVPGKTSRWGAVEPGLAHLWQLFVREPYWGSGLAPALHAEAVAEASARGFTSFRLFTPAGQARARRFYEREGWASIGAPFFEGGIG